MPSTFYKRFYQDRFLDMRFEALRKYKSNPNLTVFELYTDVSMSALKKDNTKG